MPEDQKIPMTPKRAAIILAHDWVEGFRNPHHLSPAEMTGKLHGWGYNVTEKRHEQILEQFDRLILSFKLKIKDKIQEIGGII